MLAIFQDLTEQFGRTTASLELLAAAAVSPSPVAARQAAGDQFHRLLLPFSDGATRQAAPARHWTSQRIATCPGSRSVGERSGPKIRSSASSALPSD